MLDHDLSCSQFHRKSEQLKFLVIRLSERRTRLCGQNGPYPAGVYQIGEV